MGAYDPKKTLEEANQLQVICPIFQAETSIAVCFKLREIVWRGGRPEQRQGCQACMQANKCPINNIIWEMIRKPDIDPYWSATKKVVQFKDHDLEKIARVTVSERIMDRYQLSEKELLMIRRANAAAGSGFVSKPRRGAAEEIETEIVETPTREEVDLSVAQTGDYAAAINAMIKKEAA